ncbi:hypothetical protein I4U23_019936 [Adineta vaga]|nr:hypothetical protein I4U23_019936 [Adineta vaga]
MSAPSASDLESAGINNEVDLSCTIRCGWWNACKFNGGGCPEPSDCNCRTFG